MIQETHKCHHCNSINIVKNGKNRNGNQRYKCKDCGISRVVEYKPNYTEGRKEEIIRAYQERSSLRGLSRTFGVARDTVTVWSKKN